VVSVALVVVMANSYTMEARPVWDTPLLWLYYLANAVLSGSLACAALAGIRRPADAGSAAGSAGVPLVLTVALAGAAITLVALVAYAVFIPAQAAAFTSVGNYFDPTHPTKVMADPQGALAGFLTGDQAGLFWAGALVIGALVPGALAFLARKREGATLAAMAAIGVLCALAGGICFRMVLYALGFTVFVFY
ncbi:MAG: hypothetical protein LBS98_03880, partial [Coriobacteriales bacterium]|nr:hypothetical protein [Coriobacteriales bacterium]